MAIAVLVPVASFGRIAWACSMTGEVVDTCCCPAPSLAPAARHASRVQAQDCCEMRVGQPDAAVTASADLPALVPAAVLSGRVPILDATAPAVRSTLTPLVRSRAPPRAGVPLFIQNCALLA